MVQLNGKFAIDVGVADKAREEPYRLLLKKRRKIVKEGLGHARSLKERSLRGSEFAAAAVERFSEGVNSEG